ncbi:unnamed protein product [Notodromas monacha]|uniref:Uncharacterized protein n=1 Tax=Notodromas monacha TaxID=399045 RepID=A0A7R9GIC0_9CRUS|nr:unnamed protein product [Notodromas monacha]CAG0922276.1 unnamed protein product [Notodromas monacha]
MTQQVQQARTRATAKGQQRTQLSTTPIMQVARQTATDTLSNTVQYIHGVKTKIRQFKSVLPNADLSKSHINSFLGVKGYTAETKSSAILAETQKHVSQEEH